MYEAIAANLPMLEQYQTLFQSNPHMRTILHLIYADILKFHKKAFKFFKQKGKQKTGVNSTDYCNGSY